MRYLPLILLATGLSVCKNNEQKIDSNQLIEFDSPIKIEVNGYSGNAMEPFLSRDGNILLFNNLNEAPENTNLHWATKINETSFQYKGEISGVNTLDLEGVPTLDKAGNFYFVSTRDYTNTLSTLYRCNFSSGFAMNVALVSGVSKLQAGQLNFDVEVSADGQMLYFVDGQFEQGSSVPKSADLVMAQKNATGFQRLLNSAELLQNINTRALEYAACISEDELELYFTRLQLPITAKSFPEIFISVRKDKSEIFGIPAKIASITGFVEAATISPDQNTLYYHKKENNKFVLYKVKKK